MMSEDCACVYDVESSLLTTSGDATTASTVTGSTSRTTNTNSMQPMTATHKLSFGDGCVSLNWMPQNPNLLAVGTNTGWIRVYDLRKGHPAVMSVMAHTNMRSKKVKGIRSDPFNSNLISTFTDSAGEPVKVWDLRKVEKSKEAPVFTVHPHVSVAPSTTGTAAVDIQKSCVTDIEYSPVRANVLAVGTSISDDVLLFNTKSTSMDVQSRIPIMTIHIPGGVKHLSWNRGVDRLATPASGTSESNTQASSRADNGIFTFTRNVNSGIVAKDDTVVSGASSSDNFSRNPHRLLVATRKNEYVDMTVVERQPLAMNARNEVIFGRDNKLVMMLPAPSTRRRSSGAVHNTLKETPPFSQVPSAVPRASYFGIEDALIRQRCAAGYAVDSGKNLQALSDELDLLDPSSAEASACIELLRAWSWVDRVETLHIKDNSFNLQNSGILQLMNDDNLSNSNSVSTGSSSSPRGGAGGCHDGTYHDKGLLHPVLGRPVFLSHRRSVGRLLCGWAALRGLQGAKVSQQPSSPAKHDGPFVEHSESAKLHEIVNDCEMVEHFERGAALALWHGDLAMTVKVLQRVIVGHSGGDKALAGLKLDCDDDLSKGDFEDDDEHSHDHDDHDDDVTFMSEAGGEDNSATSGGDSVASSASNDSYFSANYIELLSLVAMCIAGYSGLMTTSDSSTSHSGEHSSRRNIGVKKHDNSSSLTEMDPRVTMWASMCQLVLAKLKATEMSTGHRGVSYLYAACLFLLETQQGSENYSVLRDERIAFEDRVAFACTYLSYEQMCTFLLALENQCTKEGNIEGLVITGLKTTDGMKLLQRYVDLRNDIQTAALLVARFPSTLNINGTAYEGPDKESDSSASKSSVLEKQFLQEYRLLLNRWELYMPRASLDVELGRRYRAHQALLSKQNAASGAVGGEGAIGNSRSRPGGRSGVTRSEGGGSGGSSGGGGGDKGSGSVYRIPPHNDSPHVLLRCYYCR